MPSFTMGRRSDGDILAAPRDTFVPQYGVQSTMRDSVKLTVPPVDPKAQQSDRDAIIASLHEERRMLLGQKRAGGISERETEFLADINREIDRLEMAELTQASHVDSQWQRIESLASRILALSSK
jgi:hypothetical protein